MRKSEFTKFVKKHDLCEMSVGHFSMFASDEYPYILNFRWEDKSKHVVVDGVVCKTVKQLYDACKTIFDEEIRRLNLLAVRLEKARKMFEDA